MNKRRNLAFTIETLALTLFLLVVLVYSANAGLLEQTRTKKRIAAEANAAYQKFKAAG